MILLTVLCVIAGAVAIRAAARVVQLGSRGQGLPERSPSYGTIRLWLLRIGYYKLYRSKEQAADWVFIVDHSVQQGRMKLLFIVGVRLSALTGTMKLTHRDVEPLALVPMRQSNGAAVAKQLRTVARKTGVPRLIVADDGGDLRAGIARFRAEHQETAAIYDIKHKVACELRRILTRRGAWERFCKQANRFKRKVQQTALAPLAPPAQRSKARYMNVDVLLSWATTVGMMAVQRPEEVARKLGVGLDVLRDQMAWLGKYNAHLLRWSEVCAVAQAFESVIRNEGYHADVLATLDHLVLTPKASQARQLRQRLRTFVQQQVAQVRPGETLLGSSEVLESIFGKLKALEAGQSKEGFTTFALAAAAVTGPVDQQVVKEALEETPTKAVRHWGKRRVGRTVQAIRRALRKMASAAERKPDQRAA
jgi:hypothetical protein